jgi:hypothetical protein
MAVEAPPHGLGGGVRSRLLGKRRREARQVLGQRFQVSEGLGLEGGLHAFGEFLDVETPITVVLAEGVDDLLSVGVGCP